MGDQAVKLGVVAPRWGPQVIGGTEYWLRLLAEHLVDRSGWEVHAFTTCATSAVTWADDLPAGTTTEGGVVVHRHRSASGRSTTYAPLDSVVRRVPSLVPDTVARRFVDAVGPVNPALVDDATHAGCDLVAVTPHLYWPSIRAVRALGRRSVLHAAAHDEAELHLPGTATTFAAAGGLSYNSFAERDLVESRFPVASLPAAVVGNAVVESPGEAAAARRWLGLDPDERYVVCVGRVERVKGSHTLAEMWRTYRRRRPRAPRLVVIGAVNQPLAPSPDVVVAGTCPEDVKWGALRGAELLVSPSAWESFSLVVVEAWQAGIPVLVNRRCEPTVEQCRRSGGGLWWDGYAEFEVAVDAVLGDAGLRATLSARGQAFARSAYAWPAILERYESLCERIVARVPAGASGGARYVSQAVPGTSLTSRLAGRVRRTLGAEHLAASLLAVEARLAALESATAATAAAAGAVRWPAPPLYLGDHTALVVARWGSKLLVDTRDTLIAPWLLADGLWESHITGWFERSVRPGQTVVDVGANLGYFTVLAGRLVGPTGRVIAVEALPHLATLCRRNAVVNGQHGWTTVWQRAAWSASGPLTFHQREHYAANSSVGTVGDDDLDALGDTQVDVEIPGSTLDELLDASPGGLSGIDVIKIDVEGAEVHALAGMTATLRANPAVTLLVEWAPEQLRAVGDEPADLVEVLAGHGFGFRLFEADLAPISSGALLDTAYGNLLLTRS